jgi:hypothetical protein
MVNLTARILALNCRVADVKSFSSRGDFPFREIGTKMGMQAASRKTVP